MPETTKKDKVVQIPEELLNSKEYKKLEKQMGAENCREFFQMSEEEIRARIAESSVQAKEARNRVAENVSYKQSKGVIKDFTGSLRDTLKPLNAIVDAGTSIIDFRNELKKIK